MKLKAKAISAAIVSALGMIGTAQAVSLSEDGRGQVLIYPYFTAQGQTDTLISIVNTDTVRGKVVKVRFLEAKNSVEVLDFNLYLSPKDAWAGAVTRDASGNPILKTVDRSCTVPAIPTVGDHKEVAFRNFQVVTEADKAGIGLDRLREGYVEIIQMADTDPASVVDFDTATAGTQNLQFEITHTGSPATPANCGAVVAAWQGTGLFTVDVANGLTVPTGGLIGSATLINVPNGTDYSYDPVVLSDFSILISHTNPGSLAPSLNDAFPPISNLFLNNAVVTDNWITVPQPGARAVSAVLSHSAILNEYTINSILAAGSDWVVTFPTKKQLIVKESENVADATVDTLEPFTRRFDNTSPVGSAWFGDNSLQSATALTDGLSAGACEPVTLTFFGREEESVSSGIDFSPQPPGSTNALCWEANVITFSNSNVLESQNVKYNVTAPFSDGWLRLAFDDVNQNMTAPVTLNVYQGLPAVGFGVQRYVNGNINGVLANYGTTFIHKYERSITLP